MLMREGPILGIDIDSKEIRVVEMRGSWSQPQILRAEAVPTPPGAVENGRVVYPQPVADALRILTQRMGVRTRDVILGLPARTVMARVLEIPNVPDAEIPAILQGEMLHYHLLMEGEGAFD